MHRYAISDSEDLLVVSVEVAHHLRDLVGVQSKERHVIVEGDEILLVVQLTLLHEL